MWRTGCGFFAIVVWCVLASACHEALEMDGLERDAGPSTEAEGTPARRLPPEDAATPCMIAEERGLAED